VTGSRVDRHAADLRARRAACEEWERPLLLEAGAGTGKTAVLVSRIVHWLMGPGWERAAAELAGAQQPPGASEIAARAASGVVAITFTEAAAAEMADRAALFLAALADRDAQREPPKELTAAAALLAGEDAVERATHLLSAVDRLRVQTIHGFCRSLIAEHPAEAGVHPAFVIDAEDDAADLLLTEVVEETLPARYAAGEPSLLTLAESGLGPADLAEALRTLLAAGADARDLRVNPLSPERCRALLVRLAAAAGDLAAVLSHLPPTGGGRLDKAREALAVASELAARAAEGPDPAALEELLDDARAARGRLASKLGDWSKGELTQTEAAHLDGFRPELADAARRLRRLLGHLAELQPELLAALQAALLPLLEEIEIRRYRLGLVSFDELQSKAVRLLERHPSLARRIRGAIAQLLVDEFQDTDALQCRLVEQLALAGPPDDRPGLLLVGDPKQSIYGWRRADLAAYEGFRRRLAEHGGRVEALTVNFRSVPAILAEVERAMAPAFDPEPGVQPPFVPLVASPEKIGATGCTLGDRAPVEHWLSWKGGPEKPEKTSAHEAALLEARAIAADLARMRATGSADAPAWSEIAILLRATGDLPYYLAALREAGVPYHVDSDRSFYRQREVIDAAALVRTVLDPGDQVALVALLRSPWVGVPDPALLPLWLAGFPAALAALAGPDPEALSALRSLVDRAATRVAGAKGWEVALSAAVEGVAALRAAYRSLTSDRFVAALRARFPVEALAAARFLGAHRLASLRRLFDRLVDDLESAGGDPAPVLRRLRRAVAEEMDEPKGLPRVSGDAVQVLTIHKAKGLDFRHVYLPQLHHRSGAGNRAGDCWKGGRPEGPEFLLRGIRSLGMDEVERLADRTEAAERVRLLYVAMTRAKERLVTLGDWPGAETGTTLREGTLLHPLASALAPHRPALEDLAAGSARDASGVLWRFGSALGSAPSHRAVPERDSSGEALWRARERFAGLRAAAATRASREIVTAATSWLGRAGARLQLSFDEEGDGTAEAVATAVGTAIHRFLERLPPGGDWELERQRQEPDLRALLDRRLPSDPARGLAGAELGKILERLAAGPLRERFDRLAGRIVARELPLLLPPPADDSGPLGALTATVDLLYWDPEDGALVVADHKTDRLEDDALLFARHGPQLRLYAEGVAAALGLPAPPRAELWLLRHGRVLRLDGPETAPARPAIA